VILEIRDNGRGFAPGEVRTGNGLRTMAQRAEALGGKLDISSCPAEGTTVRAHAPIG